jgi:hypothetical protein
MSYVALIRLSAYFAVYLIGWFVPLTTKTTVGVCSYNKYYSLSLYNASMMIITYKLSDFELRFLTTPVHFRTNDMERNKDFQD